MFISKKNKKRIEVEILLRNYNFYYKNLIECNLSSLA